ncbi:hypothetical protein A2415_04060 [candidate division WWE3 bacterium RIFOXYC1_FULL_39_7]|uniref:Uncharacterized protein n=2 Tax=Katanobacteria TaxID=422282 RepID=A0A1F4X4R2_UNCKA|nr:MAG: hypothetical protein A2415_04060 [candidate division WWE3 bacterium RIFOXYC1_FULL_39_7]OGC76559.1 MAG: hypothetical protein A2619_02455 [candidate division WWE3 bacterium RIFOXYD1_FULL_39_9]
MTDINGTNLDELIPNECIDYNIFTSPRNQKFLLEHLASTRFAGQEDVRRSRYARVDIHYLWTVLTVLKRLLGPERFIESVGLGTWYLVVVVVEALPITEEELQRAVEITKQLLVELGAEDLGTPHVHQYTSIVFGYLWQFYAESYRLGHAPALPAWERIGIDKVQIPKT